MAFHSDRAYKRGRVLNDLEAHLINAFFTFRAYRQTLAGEPVPRSINLETAVAIWGEMANRAFCWA
jgi:hypothetical protein